MEGGSTVPILVEEAEGLLELGDLVVGELVRHWLRVSGGRKVAMRMGVGLNLGVGEEEDLAGSVFNLGTFPSIPSGSHVLLFSFILFLFIFPRLGCTNHT
jgi:hypothetical protein